MTRKELEKLFKEARKDIERAYATIGTLEKELLGKESQTSTLAEKYDPVEQEQESSIPIATSNGMDLETRVTYYILDVLAIPAHIKGYKYIRDAISMVVEDITLLSSITKILYPNIAEKHQTTPSRVDRAIRHAIEVGCSRCDLKKFNEIFGSSISPNKGKPTNSECIAAIADRVTMEMRK